MSINTSACSSSSSTGNNNMYVPVTGAGNMNATVGEATCYTPTSILQHSHPLFPTPISRSWGGVGGFTTPLQPAPPLCAPPLTVASSLGNPQMPTTSMYNSSSPMGYNFRLSSTNIIPACKRKSDDIEVRCPATKQHITEEKVSAGLNLLHLSSHYTNHKLGGKDVAPSKDVCDDSDSDSNSSTSSSGPRLYLSHDIKKVSTSNNSVLPETLLKNLMRDGPCMEVVLWQPRAQILAGLRCPVDKHTVYHVSTESANSSLPDLIHSAVTSPFGTTTVSTATAVSANGYPSFYTSGNSKTSVSTPDSGVSVSPPSDSGGSLETTYDMDEDLVPVALPGTSLHPIPDELNATTAVPAPFSNNPFSLFYPSTTPSCVSSVGRGALEAGVDAGVPATASEYSDAAALLNNNDGSAVSAYTRSWVEENNNTGLRDLNTRHPPLAAVAQLHHYVSPFRVDELPPLPDDDDMDL